MNYYYCLLGIAAWMLMGLKGAKDVMDEQGKKFNFINYFSHTWDNWAFALVGGFVCMLSLPTVKDWLSITKELHLVRGWEAFAGFSGSLILEILWRFISKLSGK
jgi:hypothetical protein